MSNQSRNSNQHSTATCPRTDSERLFAKYLVAGGYDWEFEATFPEKIKCPDFLVSIEDKQLLFEVKELRWREPAAVAMLFSPEKRIREKINAAQKQFKEFKDFSCSVVIANLGDGSTPLTPLNVFAAMLGDSGFTFATDGRDIYNIRNTFLPRGGKMMNYKRDTFQNTTINAIIVLEEARVPNSGYERALAGIVRRKESELGRKLSREERADLNWEPPLLGKRLFDHSPRVAVFEHPQPRVQLPNDIFRGPFDERFKVTADEIEAIYTGIRVSEMITKTGGSQRHDSDVSEDGF